MSPHSASKMILKFSRSIICVKVDVRSSYRDTGNGSVDGKFSAYLTWIILNLISKNPLFSHSHQSTYGCSSLLRVRAYPEIRDDGISFTVTSGFSQWWVVKKISAVFEMTRIQCSTMILSWTVWLSSVSLLITRETWERIRATFFIDLRESYVHHLS